MATKQELLQKALALPQSPGVYLMYNKEDTVIYVGKAKALKNRVCQYFRSGSDHTPKVARMVSLAHRFEYVVCENEFEALVLEASLIKQYQPKYNILLKDDKGYHYIKITPAPWRRISAVKQKNPQDGCRYLGPFYSGFVVSSSLEEALKAFMLPTCHKKFPEDFRKGRPCLNHAIGLCRGVCTGKISLKEYEDSVDNALLFLQKGAAGTIKKMQADMLEASENLQFEKAAHLRDRIRALKKITQKQKIVEAGNKTQDVIALARTPDKGCFEIFHFETGSLTGREHYFIDIGVETDLHGEFLMQYYSQERPVPPFIVLDKLPENPVGIATYLSEKRGKKTELFVPQKGSQKELLTMCLQNAEERLLNTAGRKSREESVLAELAGLLNLPAPPHRIEAYDISHTAGAQVVAGMVVYIKGKPHKKDYRRFSIREATGGDDTASMAEVLRRRFAEYHKAKTPEGFGALPDLILLDGGKGQLTAVLSVLHAAGLELPVVGMVKDSRHHTRALVSRQGELEIKANRSVFTFISSIQEEVHRFAVSFHRKKTSDSLTHSALLDIPGIGPKRAGTLLTRFGNVEAIAQATQEQLTSIEGIDRTTAHTVWQYFHEKQQS